MEWPTRTLQEVAHVVTPGGGRREGGAKTETVSVFAMGLEANLGGMSGLDRDAVPSTVPSGLGTGIALHGDRRRRGRRDELCDFRGGNPHSDPAARGCGKALAKGRSGLRVRASTGVRRVDLLATGVASGVIG